MKPMASAPGRTPIAGPSADYAGVTAGFLCLIQRPVRTVKGGIRRVLGDEVGYSAGRRDGDRLVVKVESKLRDLDANLVRHGARCGGRGADEQHDKFLAAVARHEVRLAHVLRELLTEDAQHPVAGFMAVSVIDALEAVNIPGKDADRAPEALPAPELLFNAVVVGGTVRDAGERVDHRQALFFLQADVQAVAFALQFADA